MSRAETYMQDYERHRQIRKELGAGNKAAIFDVLVAANITEVLVEFDGEGDSGQIEMVTVVLNGEPVPMPEAKVTMRQASFGSSEPVISECSLREGIETLCYDFLEEEHGGWENNDGAFGEFRLDVQQRTVELEFHARFTDVTISQSLVLTEANMAHPYHHSLSSVRKWGGTVEDYQPVHDWFDESKKIIADFRHRALRHHAEGIFMAETIFGSTITLSTGRVIPVRWIGEQHVREDLGFIPSFADWVKTIRPEHWMGRAVRLENTLDTPVQPVAGGQP